MNTKKFYKCEAEAFNGSWYDPEHDSPTIEKHDAENLVRAAARFLGIERPRVYFAEVGSTSAYYPGRGQQYIVFLARGLRQSVVLHEVAHAAVDLSPHKDTGDHGPLFIAFYLRLLSRFGHTKQARRLRKLCDAA